MTSGKQAKQKRQGEMSREDKIKSFALKEKKQKTRQKQIIIGAMSIFAVLLAVGIFSIVQVSRTSETGAAQASPVVGYNAEAKLEVTDNSIIVGAKDAPHKFTVYEDAICPFCGEFEESSHSEFTTMIDNGEAKVEYVTVAFLDQASSDGKYSSRVASLLAATAKHQPEKWYDLHEELFAQQPEEGSTLTNAQLLNIASQVDVKDENITKALKSVSYQKWVNQVTEKASKDGITGTPSIFLDGKKINVRSGADVRQALEAVK